MRTSDLPFPNSLIIPEKIEDMKTSELMERGPLIFFKNPGLAYYAPIGNIVLDNLRYMVRKEHESIGAMEVKIPSCMKRSLLDSGEKIEKTFSDKFIMLPKYMEEYILLTTHEIEILDWLRMDYISHKSLPLRLSFSREILRPIKYPKGILKLREPEIYMMLSLDLDQERFKDSLRKYSKICETIFGMIGISYEKQLFVGETRRGPHLDFDLEYFYRTTEGENVLLTSDGRKEKALSLSMAYRYEPSPEFIRVTTSQNRLVSPIVGTYAMGLERLLFASFDSSRDSIGFNLPKSIRPFDISILVFGDEEELYQKAEEIYDNLSSEGKRVLLDNRTRCKRTDKARLSDYLGIPKKIILSKSGIKETERRESDYSNINSHHFH